jgi:hypothetical protein
MQMLDISPSPQILIALTRTPLTPLDALCELIDNAFDSFRAAKTDGLPIRHPLIEVHVPTAAELRSPDGVIRVRDNGPGLTEAGLANALRAGYTSKNPYDTLGLFGMGFNIATGKLGRITKIVTAKRGDTEALEASLDLTELVKTRRFEVPVRRVPKPFGLEHGTFVEIRGWWEQGNPNADFIKKLAQISKPQLRTQLGRRYATLLRKESAADSVRVIVNGDPCAGFEHCAWSEERFVERQGWGRIPAVIRFNDSVSNQVRCGNCPSVSIDSAGPCPECGSTSKRTVEERIRGWVGIQRYDDESEFGIDLIRNGRAIRIAERRAFFSFVDDNGREVNEYPVDQIYGRIIGEIHLDHVPVDFQKQDFQRATQEWQRAMDFIRGKGLQPKFWPQDEPNETPVSRLFQGYRKVRRIGKADMYMGTFDVSRGEGKRIDRAIEHEYYERFLRREPGYYDDAKWWELVEQASTPPVTLMEECSVCGYQNPPGSEACGGCSEIFVGKECLNPECRRKLKQSDVECPVCGSSQVPQVVAPWKCEVCAETNQQEASQCGRCGSPRGTLPPCSLEVLRAASEPNEALSATALTVALASGDSSSPFDITVRTVKSPLRPVWNGAVVPLVTYRSPGKLEIFIDLSHRLFQKFGLRPEVTIASEAAQYLYDLHSSSLSRNKAHALGNLMDTILAARWQETLSVTPTDVKREVERLLAEIKERLIGLPQVSEFYNELEPASQRALADNLISSGVDLVNLAKMKETGEFVRYVPPSIVQQLFRQGHAAWFGKVWGEKLPGDEFGEPIGRMMRDEFVSKYQRCLEDCISFLSYQRPEPLIVTRARASCDYLTAKLAS